MKVCVVGAGVSGLVTAKTFLEDGHEVTLFEKDGGLGGVWGVARAYVDLEAQNPRDTYSYSDHPMPRDYPEWLSAAHVRSYLESYAERFGVAERIHYNRRVMLIERVGEDEGQARWRVHTAGEEEVEGDAGAREDFDKVVVCNGIHCTPNIPAIDGRERFERAGGRVMHSSDVTDEQLLAGKRVVVVGFGKSACDVAMVAHRVGSRASLVYRRPHWKIPAYWFDRINYKYVLMARHSELLFRYYRMTLGERVLHTLGRPIIKMAWRLIEGYLNRRQRLEACGMRPPESIETAGNCNLSLETRGFFQAVAAGELPAHRGNITRYHEGEVELDDGTRLPADVVVFGTGWVEGAPFIEDRFRRRFVDAQGFIHLYRQIYHPDLPDLGFVGYNSSFHGQLSSEIAAIWLRELFTGHLRLPPRAEMLAEAEAVLNWRRNERPIGIARGTCVIPFDTH
ncbi:MAG: FAD-dependent oxidoreductase, partial [Myxococcales bacterium]|nr:FAD-dependent oxidoreductase [Myxococcales bacterium]